MKGVYFWWRYMKGSRFWPKNGIWKGKGLNVRADLPHTKVPYQSPMSTLLPPPPPPFPLPLLHLTVGLRCPPGQSFKFGSFGDGNGELNYPCYVAVNPQGHVIVSDMHSHRIQVRHRRVTPSNARPPPKIASLSHPLPPPRNFVTGPQSPMCHQYKMAPLNVHRIDWDRSLRRLVMERIVKCTWKLQQARTREGWKEGGRKEKGHSDGVMDETDGGKGGQMEGRRESPLPPVIGHFIGT